MTDTQVLFVFVAITALFVLAVFGTQPERRNPRRKPRPPTWHTRRPR